MIVPPLGSLRYPAIPPATLSANPTVEMPDNASFPNRSPHGKFLAEAVVHNLAPGINAHAWPILKRIRRPFWHTNCSRFSCSGEICPQLSHRVRCNKTIWVVAGEKTWAVVRRFIVEFERDVHCVGCT